MSSKRRSTRDLDTGAVYGLGAEPRPDCRPLKLQADVAADAEPAGVTSGTVFAQCPSAMLGIVHRKFATLVLAGLVIAATASCGSSAKQACGPVTHDPLDPGSGTHILPGAPTPSYLVDPPTSGAHQPTPPVEGVRHTPIAHQIQVGILEEGRVLIQYHGLSQTDTSAVQRLVSKQVVVAPARELPGNSHVVATSWVTHQSCTAVDAKTLKRFIATRAGKGPGHP